MAREISQASKFVPEIPDLTRPAHVPKDEAWFWTEAWQAGEREANEDLAAGRYKVFSSVDEMIADLRGEG